VTLGHYHQRAAGCARATSRAAGSTSANP